MKNQIKEDKEQNGISTKGINTNGNHEPSIKTAATDNKKNMAEETEGLNQANSINNNLEPGGKLK